MSSADHKTHLDLSTELNRRMKIDHVFEELGGHNLLSQNSIEPLPRNFDCLRNLMNTYETHCGRMDDYDLKYVKHFVSHCELNE